MGCDICRKVGETYSLNALIKIPDVRDVCGDCKKVGDKLLEHYRDMAWIRCAKKMKAMKKRYESKAYPQREIEG